MRTGWALPPPMVERQGDKELETMDTREIIELLEGIERELDAELAQARAELDEAEGLALAV